MVGRGGRERERGRPSLGAGACRGLRGNGGGNGGRGRGGAGDEVSGDGIEGLEMMSTEVPLRMRMGRMATGSTEMMHETI